MNQEKRYADGTVKIFESSLAWLLAATTNMDKCDKNDKKYGKGDNFCLPCMTSLFILNNNYIFNKKTLLDQNGFRNMRPGG